MKKTLLFIALILSFYTFAQNEVKITSKKCVIKKGYYLRLKAVFDDSRCPEGVTCVWAGEVSATLEVYKNKKLIEEKTMIFNSKNLEENKKWLENYYSKKIKEIQLLPYPKHGKTIKFKNQFVQIFFTD